MRWGIGGQNADHDHFVVRLAQYYKVQSISHWEGVKYF